MTRPNFTATAVERAVKGATKAGLSIARVDIDPFGRISLVSDVGAQSELPANDMDRELEEWRNRNGKGRA